MKVENDIKLFEFLVACNGINLQPVSIPCAQTTLWYARRNLKGLSLKVSELLQEQQFGTSLCLFQISIFKKNSAGPHRVMVLKKFLNVD